jgi:hypothetical protein
VYGATSTVVYVGYTPGYYGTVVAPDGTVIYGTGYIYPAWVGAYYYPPPMTYGFGACVRWTPWTGWSVGFGFGYAYGGVAVSMTFGGAMWGVHPYYGPAYYGGHYGYGSWAGTTGNMYSHYGSTSAVTNRSGGYNAYTGNGWSHNMGASYNSATGIAAAGQRTTVGNAYTGGYASYASGTVANTNTGRSTSVSSLQTNYGSAVKVGNNVYGDANGNVFKDNGGGSWSQWGGGGGGGGGLGGGGGSGGWGNWGGSRSMNSQAWSRDAGASRASSFSGGGWGGGGGFGGGRR